MIEKIYLYYNFNEKVIYCFWKCFFQICGIWIEEKVIGPEDCKINKQTPCLLILGREEDKCTLDKEKENCVYLIHRKSKIKSENRTDCIKLGMWKDNEKIFNIVLRKLFYQKHESDELQKLLTIFMEEKLWNAFWLHNEMVYGEKSDFDSYIINICKRVMARNDVQRAGWHRRFMNIYCEYIISSIAVEGFLDRIVDARRLLDKCNELADNYDWTSALCVMAAKICGLSQIEQKYALNYYRSVHKSDITAELLYNIGRIYEKIIGDDELAIDYYKKSCYYDKTYYRAIYKMAVDSEKNGVWMKAFSLYDNIKTILKGKSLKDAISIREIEYYYKSIKGLIRICEKNINSDLLVNSFVNEIEKLKDDVDKGEPFQKLFYCMLGEEGKKQSKQISNNIYVNNLVDCLTLK